VAESLMPGARVADVARKYGATRWQVYEWRKRLRKGALALPEDIATAPAFAALLVDEPRPKPANACIDIVMDDVVIRAGQDADERHLSRVIRAVRAAT